jgi:DNA (cytosine-5)-methyltransferase 1
MLSDRPCTFKAMSSIGPRVAALFAGIGGLELGLSRAGAHAELLCEWWDPARQVLAHHWPDVRQHGDVRTLRSLPRTEIVTAGFPCTDLSQAGRMAGITGANSGLVGEVFRLLARAKPTWLVLENVRNMLVLDRGRAMRYLVDELEGLGYRWAYRLVDSRSSGVPQRRQRVLLVASRTEDPRGVVLADDAGEPQEDAHYRDDAFGFYWTEGLKGLGWARDAVPTLKGGSTVGVPSPPAVWVRSAGEGRRIVVPTIEQAEVMQGFPPGWTEPAQRDGKRNGPRWKLVGNAVTTGVSEWLGERLIAPGPAAGKGRPLESGSKWPAAAWGGKGKAWSSDVSLWPRGQPYVHLMDVVDPAQATPLSHRGTAGFLSRAERSTLRFDAEFLVAVKEHLSCMSA